MSAGLLNPALADTASYTMMYGRDRQVVRFDDVTYAEALQNAKDTARNELWCRAGERSEDNSCFDMYKVTLTWTLALVKDTYRTHGHFDKASRSRNDAADAQQLTREQLLDRALENERSHREMLDLPFYANAATENKAENTRYGYRPPAYKAYGSSVATIRPIYGAASCTAPADDDLPLTRRARLARALDILRGRDRGRSRRARTTAPSPPRKREPHIISPNVGPNMRWTFDVRHEITT